MLVENCDILRCMVMEGKCIDKCDNLLNRQECGESEYCTWLFSEYTGDSGRCILKSSNNYLCSDIKRYWDCYNGGNINILLNKCEYYKVRCREKCELYLNEEECLKDEKGDCLWMKNGTENNGTEKEGCRLKVYILNYMNYFFLLLIII
jgi:hypothetical protein